MLTRSASAPAKRLRRTLTALFVAVFAIWGGLVVVYAGGAGAAPAGPTMTFKGSLNLLGLLNGIMVQPTAVSVPAGGQATFVNSSGVPLSVTVGGQSVTMASGASKTFAFAGQKSSQRVFARATPLNVPLVGALTSSTGTINVAAAPPAAAPANPAPANPANPAPANPANPGAPAAGRPNANNPAGQPNVPQNFGQRPAARDAQTGGGVPPSVAQKPGGDPVQPDLGSPAAPAKLVTAPKSSFSSTSDELGLMILIATVLVAGVGAAAVRVVLAQRPAMAGAHTARSRRVHRRR